MLNQLDAADFVLVVCTPTYYRRFRGHEVPGKGKGADWEGALITQELYDARSATLKFVPIFLSATDETCVPEPLRSQTHYALTSEINYQSLYDFLLGQAGVEPGPVGVPQIKPCAQGATLSFAEHALATSHAPPVVAFKADISRIDKYAPEELIGRESEMELLNDAWMKVPQAQTQRRHVLTLVAMGGEGKTSLVAKWAAQLAHDGWPGCDAVFAWSFYSQGTREQTAASSDLFLVEALRFFGDTEMAQSNQSAFDKARRLAQLVGGQRALLILDGLEPLQYAPTSPTPGELRDGAMAGLLKALAVNSKGLCVLTTRYALADLRNYLQTTVLEHHLLRLSEPAGVQLLHCLGVHGSAQELAALVESVRGHALTLNLLGTYLRDAHGGDVRKRDQVKLEEADAEEQGGHAFRVVEAYVQWLGSPDKNAKEAKRGRRAIAVLRMLGLFDRPASADCLHALLKAPSIRGLTDALSDITVEQRNIVYARLEAAKLLTVKRDAAGELLLLDAHPLVREYFGKTLKEQHPESWRQAHRRIFDHLCATTREGKQPNLEDLLPLFQAVVHGCQAKMLMEACVKVYYHRIQRGEESYGTGKLGAHGSDLCAIACFFDVAWSRVKPGFSASDQAWLLNQAGYSLRALGRLHEAQEPMRIGLEMRVSQAGWREAAIMAINLSELNLAMGHIDTDSPYSAVQLATKSVLYASREARPMDPIFARTALANALLQAGRTVEARRLFEEAEALQAERKPRFPLLNSLRGFQYVDLLLQSVERDAWRVWMRAASSTDRLQLLEEIGKRTAATLEWMKEGERGAVVGVSLLDIALHYLSRGRTRLYFAIFQIAACDSSACRNQWFDRDIDLAVDGFRRAASQDQVPVGLLNRAWSNKVQGTNPASAGADLDEAWELAERGPMPLFLADIHLHRARLFFRDQDYPWSKNDDGRARGPLDDLADARRLIERHGYWRRKEELEDAEAAITAYVEAAH